MLEKKKEKKKRKKAYARRVILRDFESKPQSVGY